MNRNRPRVVAAVPTDAAPDFGRQIRDLRAAAGLTQHELAIRSGTSQPAIASLESNRRVPTLSTLTKLARALGHDLIVVLPCNGRAADASADEAVS